MFTVPQLGVSMNSGGFLTGLKLRTQVEALPEAQEPRRPRFRVLGGVGSWGFPVDPQLGQEITQP